MTLDTSALVRKLPKDWCGLFGSFRLGSRPLLQAERWYQETMMSVYGNQPSWNTLLESLSALEPCLDKGNLSFMPLFSLLAPDLQKAALSFLVHHKAELPSQYVRKFTDSIGENCRTDSWLSALLKLLSNQAACANDDGTSQDLLEWTGNYYEFSPDVQLQANSLLEKFKKRHSDMLRLWSEQSDWVQKVAKDSADSGSRISNSLQTGEDAAAQKPSMMAPQREECIDMVDLTVQETPPPLPLDHEEPDFSENNYEKGIEEPMCVDGLELPVEIQESISKLKEFWLNADEDSESVPSEVVIFVTCSPEQVEVICQILDFQSMPENSIANMCRHIFTISEEISFASSMHIARLGVLPKFESFCQSTTRVLAGALMSFAEKFPKQFVNGVVIPCAIQGKLGMPHTDLLNRINKDVFGTGHKVYFLEQMSLAKPPFTDGTMAVLERILDGKVELPAQLISQLLTWFEPAAVKMSENLKYGQLILAFVTRYRKHLTADHVAVIQSLMVENKTYLKKTVTAMLKRLS